MISVKQCLICEGFDIPIDVMNELDMAGLVKTEPYLCKECRKKILDLLNGKPKEANDDQR